MRFAILASAALVPAALAVEINKVTPATLKAGGQATIEFSPASPAATIILRKGASGNLQTIGTLDTAATGGSVVVNIPGNIPDGTDYTFEIDQAGSQPNFWTFFAVTGGVASSSAASTSAPSSSASASSAAVTTSTSVVTVISTASASVSTSSSGNHTISSATLSTGSATGKATGSATTTGGVPAGTGAASTLSSSPFALIFGAVAAIAYLN